MTKRWKKKKRTQRIPNKHTTTLLTPYAAADPASPRLFRWQLLFVALLVSGYAGFYLCRSNLSVVLPLLIDELVARGADPQQAKIRLGTLASLGVLAYAVGKFVGGGLADWLGGKRGFLGGMAGAVVFTGLFATSGGWPLFTLAWMGNRFVQALGWPGMVKLTARWFAHSRYGAAMGVISLSYLFGDAAARQLMGWWLQQGFGWRAVFCACATVLGALLLLNYLLLKESPQELDIAEPPADPDNLFQTEASEAAPTSFKTVFRTLLSNTAFRLVCLLSFGFHVLRETFNTWTPTYFTQVAGLTQAEAASQSALFPFFGGLSALLVGWLSDRVGRSGRALIIVLGMVLTCGGLLALARLDGPNDARLSVWLVAFIAFALIGPYSYLAGVLSLDFGGKRGSATASGIIDGIGYLGGVLAGDSVARISVSYGWQGAFNALAVIALLVCLAAAQFWRTQKKMNAV
jgi:sugar phosphate permease